MEKLTLRINLNIDNQYDVETGLIYLLRSMFEKDQDCIVTVERSHDDDDVPISK